jgi:uncharacterized phage infection (PIP) family protein YhgE
MTYLLFFLSIGLITGLALVFNQLRQQRAETIVAKLKLKEADEKIKAAGRVHHDLILRDQSIRQLENQIKLLQDQLKNIWQQFEQSEHDLPPEILKISQLQELVEEKEKARQDANDLYKDIEKEIEDKTKKYEERIRELESINTSLRKENQNLKIVNPTLKQAPSKQDEVIALKVLEQDFYAQEKIGILVDVLRNSLGNVHENSRRQHIITDIVSNNIYDANREEIKAEIRNLFRDYRRMNSNTKNALERMGFEIVSENSNYKMIFHGDSRYMISFAKTPSDFRAGRNIASDICNLLL